MDELVAGRYQLVRMLGRGGMGEVVLARQLNLDRLVVVKRVTDLRSKRSLRALVDEARIAARLNHPNIVAVLDVIDTAEQPIVVMEFVAGVSLREMIEEAPSGLPLEVALPIALDLLRGLGYAHGVRSGEAIGVVHRDVKPRNVMVTFAGVTKLIDFGISRWLADDGKGWEATSVSGTRGYMAPEQQRGGRIDGRADIYAVGVTLREMLTGAPPVDDTGNAGVAPREIEEPQLRAIVERGCAERPANRFADCTEMIAAIETFASAAKVVLSVTQVERYTSSRFADRKAFLEHDAARPTRLRPPTSPTMPDSLRVRGSDPMRIGTRIQLDVTTAGEEWMAGVTERLLRKHVRAMEDRRFHVVTADDAQRVELVCGPAGGGFQIAVMLDGRLIDTGSGGSLSEASLAVMRILTDLAPEQPSLAADPEEQAEMRRLDARSVPAYRRYRAVVDVFLAHNFADSHLLARSMEASIELDPEWPRTYALLVVLFGIHTPDATSILATARARCTSGRDPNGLRLLEALDLIRREQPGAARDALTQLFDADPRDPLVGSHLLRAFAVMQELDDASAVARRCHQEHPHLWFGADLADCFRRSGRDREAELVIRDCVSARPENIGTAVALVRQEAAAMRLSEAARHAANLLAIHGEQSDLLPELFEAMLASDQVSHARRLAERMLLGTPIERARGRYRMAVIAVLEGKFASAHNSLRKAIEANRVFSLESELSQCLELGRVIARLVGDVATQRRLTSELAEAFASMIGDSACAAILRYELAVLERGSLEPEDHLVGLEGASRDLARTRMLRTAALTDPSLSRAVVDAGFAGNEDNTASLLALGICAHRQGELAIARKSFETASRLWSSILSNQASPYHAVLAHYHLAATLAELDDRVGARAHYEVFLKAWGDADRPVAEVAAARKALAAL